MTSVIEVKEGVAPETPASGYVRIFATTDGHLSAKDDTGDTVVYGHEFGFDFAVTDALSGYRTPPIEIPYKGTIVSVRVTSNSACTLQVHLWKGLYNSLPLASNLSIVAAAPVVLAGAYKNEDTTLTGWTTALAAGDWIQAVFTSVSAGSAHTVSIRAKRVP